MAFIVGNNINVDDLGISKVIGLDVLFNANSAFKPVYSTKDKIKANLVNYVLTGQGERMMNPSYGLGIRNLLFENVNDISSKEAEIESKIKANFPQIEIMEISLSMDEFYENTLLFKMTYRVSNTVETVTLGIQ